MTAKNRFSDKGDGDQPLLGNNFRDQFQKQKLPPLLDFDKEYSNKKLED